MLKTIQVELDINDFKSVEDVRAINSIMEENITNSYLIDSLYLLRFTSFQEISNVFYNRYHENLVYLSADPTPLDMREEADYYGVFISKKKVITIYVPLDIVLDKTIIETSPAFVGYHVEYKYIMACNATILRKGLDPTILSTKLLDFRPLLVIRRLILDCIACGGTDIHFNSFYENKERCHKVQYRVSREIIDSGFHLDFELVHMAINKLIDRKSSTLPIDLETINGMTTDIPNIFNDETVDLRFTGSIVSAGLYVVIAIQQVTTTSKKIDELGFPKEDTAKLKEIAKKNEGLVLNTGPMRSGKNTTIFGILNEKIHMPIRIIEYSNPVEVRMPIPQINYKGDINALKSLMRMAKKQDLDYAVLNEIPNQEVAFAVRDLVNSAVGVITTTHLTRVWHLPYKLEELYGKDYKTIISQLLAVVNHRMFREQVADKLIAYDLTKDTATTAFSAFAYELGVRRYFEPAPNSKIHLRLQPLVEILIFNDEIRTQLLNNTMLSDSEQFLEKHIKKIGENLETKLVHGINMGQFNIRELEQFYMRGD